MLSRRHIGGVLVALLSTNAIAAEGASPSNTASIYAGGEWGNTDSQRLDAGAVFRYHTATVFSAAVSRGEADLTVGRASSTYATARVTHDFGSFGLGAGVRHGEVENVSTTLGWFASGFYDHREMRIVAEIESRDSELAPTSFTEDFGPGVGVVSGTSGCDVASIGYSAQFTLGRPRWSLYASARGYDYADFECALVSADLPETGLPGRGRGRGRALGRRLAAGALQRVSGFASRLMPREATLLESSASLGAMMPFTERWYGGLELYHDVEKLGSTDFATALAFAGMRLNGGVWITEFSLGYTAVDVIEDTTFVGLRVTAEL
jgi:hypothetical protein